MAERVLILKGIKGNGRSLVRTDCHVSLQPQLVQFAVGFGIEPMAVMRLSRNDVGHRRSHLIGDRNHT